MSGYHHPYAPSAAERWLACPGSVHLSRGMASGDSVYAEEGTRAHEAAAKFLETETLTLDDREMTEAIELYARTVWMLKDMLTDPVFKVEHKLESKTIPEFGGTIDCLLTGKVGRIWHCFCVDLKYGKGIAVDAEDNAQAMSYLLLARENYAFLQKESTRYHIVIVQPRTGGQHVKHSLATDEDVAAFAQLIRASQENPDKFKAGDHCRWCPAQGICPTLYQHTLTAAQEAFPDDVTDEVRQRWIELLRHEKAIKSLYARLPGLVLSEMQKGHKFEGYKAVESLGNRTWTIQDETKLRKVLAGADLSTDYFFTKVKSPSQLEREVSEEEYEHIAQFVHRPSRGVVLAPESDRREEVDFGDPLAPFDD